MFIHWRKNESFHHAKQHMRSTKSYTYEGALSCIVLHSENTTEKHGFRPTYFQKMYILSQRMSPT